MNEHTNVYIKAQTRQPQPPILTLETHQPLILTLEIHCGDARAIAHVSAEGFEPDIRDFVERCVYVRHQSQAAPPLNTHPRALMMRDRSIPHARPTRAAQYRPNIPACTTT